MPKRSQRGFFTIFVLVTAAVFLVLFSDLVRSILLEKNVEDLGTKNEKALHFAEAGLEYYRWHFSAFPGDIMDGTGNPGSYAHTVLDPATGASAGSFSLTIAGENSCGVLTRAVVTSVGSENISPSNTQTIIGTYGKPTVAASTTPATSNASVILATLTNLKSYAQSSGVYIPPSTRDGYKVVFNTNGSVTVTSVTDATSIWGYSTLAGWAMEETVINTLGTSTTYAIPAGCPVVFVEDTVWLEGVVSGKVTFAAADLITAKDPNIILTGSVTYANQYTNGLTAIADGSVLISPASPDVMELYGVYVAGKGRFERHRYDASGANAVPSSLSGSVLRSTLLTFGVLVSQGGVVTTKWTSSGAFISGYSTRVDTQGALVAKNPPPFTPETASVFRILNWHQ